VLGTVARGPLPIKKKRIKKKRIGLSRAPGPYTLDVRFMTHFCHSSFTACDLYR
jgi:hypothetical protein